jgi:hypothetical protein
VLGLGVAAEVADAHRHRQAEDLAQVAQVALDVGRTTAQGLEVLAAQVGQLDAAVELQRAHRGHHHRAGRAQAGRRPAARHLMSMNFSAPRSAPKPASVTT